MAVGARQERSPPSSVADDRRPGATVRGDRYRELVESRPSERDNLKPAEVSLQRPTFGRHPRGRHPERRGFLVKQCNVGVVSQFEIRHRCRGCRASPARSYMLGGKRIKNFLYGENT